MKTLLVILALFTLTGCSNGGPWADHPSSPEDVYRTQRKLSGSMDSTHSYDATVAASAIDPFGMMHSVFAGRPEIDTLKPMIDSMLAWHHLDVDDYSRTNLANSLLWFRRDSRKGITELQILRAMHQNFNANISLFKQVKQAAGLLEKVP